MERTLIDAYSRFMVESGLRYTEPHIIISITDLPSDMADIPKHELCRGILRLSFPDRDRVPSDDVNDLFSEDQARTIWKFVLGHTDMDIVVHCTAGHSRSPGVAAAISKALAGDDMRFFRNYSPNMHVYRTMLNVYHEEFQ